MAVTKKKRTPVSFLEECRQWAERELDHRYGYRLSNPVSIEWEVPDPVHVERDVGGSVELVSLAPPACSHLRDRRIFLHPYIWDSSAPVYVSRYLVYHELLHFFLPPSRGESHHELFLQRERAAPQRISAKRWLKNNDFPVLE